MSVSSSPRGEHPGRPGATWETELARYEVAVPDRDGDSPFAWIDTDPPRPNRATRRAAARAARRNQ